MIISLTDANTIDANITQEDLDSFEQSVRSLTSNNFQNKRVRFEEVKLFEPNVIHVKQVRGLRIGDTLEVNYSDYNDGLFVVTKIEQDMITVSGRPFIAEMSHGITVTLVEYPADVKKGIKGLIAYDVVMVGKVGIKSESVARMSTTYYDATASENVDGYPAAMLSFVKKYEKIRWG